jgi:hypothetical protein
MKADPKGMWGENVHSGKTKEWGILTGLTGGAAGIIAAADNAIDTDLSTGVKMDLGRHMDTGGGSQRQYWKNHREMTTKRLEQALKTKKKKFCKLAAQEFGKGLHSLQDTSSHRPYPFGPGWPKVRGSEFNDGEWGGWPKKMGVGGVVVHPTWWDYYGPISTQSASEMNTMDGETYDDENWATLSSADGGVYDKWRGTPLQILSQAFAQIVLLQ